MPLLIQKRKRLSDDVNDEFDFGIDRALADGIYVAAYPLHDVRMSMNFINIILLNLRSSKTIFFKLIASLGSMHLIVGFA